MLTHDAILEESAAASAVALDGLPDVTRCRTGAGPKFTCYFPRATPAVESPVCRFRDTPLEECFDCPGDRRCDRPSRDSAGGPFDPPRPLAPADAAQVVDQLAADSVLPACDDDEHKLFESAVRRRLFRGSGTLRMTMGPLLPGKLRFFRAPIAAAISPFGRTVDDFLGPVDGDGDDARRFVDAASNACILLPDKLGGLPDLLLLGDAEWREILAFCEGDEELRRRYGSAPTHLYVSRPAFACDRTFAMIYVADAFDLTGGTYLWFWRKVGRHWEFLSAITLSVS